MKNYFKRMFGEKKKSFLFTTKNIAIATGNGDRISTSGNHVSNAIYISDFVPSQYVVSTSVGTFSGTNSGSGMLASAPEIGNMENIGKDERKSVEPIAVFDEIKRENPEISFVDLDEKIKVVSERINILKEHLDETHLQDEHRALFFLKNRRKYLETKKKFPLDWAMTTQEAVNDLCKNYKLRVVPLKQFYTLVPNEGIKEMNRYTKAYKSITGDTPIFELIIKETETVKPEEKEKQKKKDRDPILLANSPLGNFLFILGAWDDEVEIVDEIIYSGK